MTKKLIFIFSFIALFICSDSLFSQKYWIMFKNKNGTPYSVSTPSAYLSPKSIARRTAQGIAINTSDLPVTPSYVSQIAAVPSVTVLYRSKWLNGVVINVTNTVALTTINSFTFVQTTNRVNKFQITRGIIDNTQINPNNNANRTNSTSSYNYGPAVGQATMVGVDCLHNMGFQGQGMTIAILDAGFLNANIEPTLDSLFIQKRVLGTRDFVVGDTMVFEDDQHGAYCLSTMAALSSGTMVGTAPKASYWLLRTEDVATETISEEYNWCRGIEFADSVGADVTTTSLGYTQFDGGPPSLNNHTYSTLNGRTAPMSIAANMATRKGMIVLNAAGNEGCSGPSSCWYYVGVPADADSIISVGSVGMTGVKSGFSSFGPTFDGRIKPDLVAQGGPAYVCNSGCMFGNGTSFATPVLAGAVTCLWQSKPGVKNMQIVQGLKQYANNSLAPDNSIGWGIPNMCTVYHSTIGIKEYEKNSDCSIYPNPFNNSINIVLAEVQPQKMVVSISNVLGQILFTETLMNPGNVIQLSEVGDLGKGIYFVNISSAQYNVTKKIVKQ